MPRGARQYLPAAQTRDPPVDMSLLTEGALAAIGILSNGDESVLWVCWTTGRLQRPPADELSVLSVDEAVNPDVGYWRTAPVPAVPFNSGAGVDADVAMESAGMEAPPLDDSEVSKELPRE